MSQMANEWLLNSQPVETDIDQEKRLVCVRKTLIKWFLPNAQDNLNSFLKGKHLTAILSVEVDSMRVDFTTLSTKGRGIQSITSSQRDMIRQYMLAEFASHMNGLYMKTPLARMITTSYEGLNLNERLVQVRACGRYCSQVPIYRYRWSVQPLY